MNQLDTNYNLVGDACDEGLDSDKDGVPDNVDNCPDVDNAEQLDTDDDGLGDECDDDIDGDGVDNKDDNCPLIPNKDQVIFIFIDFFLFLNAQQFYKMYSF